MTPEEIEQTFVHTAYDKIASHFNSTRYLIWPKIKEFLSTFPVGTLIGEIGCGNGKNLNHNSSHYYLGMDICMPLLQFSYSKIPGEYCVGNNLCLPLRDNVFDCVLSIAVLHHFASYERRQQALRELIRITRVSGHILIYVWSYEANNKKYNSQDVLIKWDLQKKHNINNTEEVVDRYYHLFKQGELEELVGSSGSNGSIDKPTVKIIKSGFDHENWFCVLEKQDIENGKTNMDVRIF